MCAWERVACRDDCLSYVGAAEGGEGVCSTWSPTGSRAPEKK